MNMNETIFIRKEQEGDNTEINALYANSFGPGRYVKSTFRYREKYDHLMSLSVEERAKSENLKEIIN